MLSGAGLESNTALSLLTPEEELDLDLKIEAQEVTARGMKFASLPIPDRQVLELGSRSVSGIGPARRRSRGGEERGRALPPGSRAALGLVAACLLVDERHEPGSGREEIERGARQPGARDRRAAPLDRPLRRSFGRHKITVVRRWFVRDSPSARPCASSSDQRTATSEHEATSAI